MKWRPKFEGFFGFGQSEVLSWQDIIPLESKKLITLILPFS